MEFVLFINYLLLVIVVIFCVNFYYKIVELKNENKRIELAVRKIKRGEYNENN